MDEKVIVAEKLRDMGEPPSSVDYLMRLRFNGEEVTVQAPSQRFNPISSDEE